MANKGFFRTVRAFSCGAALLATALAAAFFASVSLFSCSNMGDDYSSAGLFSQPQSGEAVVQAKIGKARVCGTIEKDSGVSASVVPTAADVISSASSYAVYAWGTKADGTVVPQTSPISGTVSSGGSGVTFSIDLDYGTWTVRADALDSSSNVVLSKTTAAPLVLDEDNPLANLSFSLNYLQDPSVPGSLSLTLNYSTTAGIASIRYSLQKKSGGSPLAGTVAAPASGTFTLDSAASSDLGTLVPGEYDLVAEFLSASGATIMRLDQTVQIYSNITTNKIDGSAPYISGGSVNVSDGVITKYQQSVVYVGGVGIGTGTAASDANNGTQFDPVATLGRAFAIADSLISVPTDGVKIYVQDNISLTQNVAIASSKKIRAIGTNQSALYKVDGAVTYGLSASASDLSFSYINFDRVKGFEISAGQANFANCSITNGVAGSSENGGGLLVKDGAKAVLTSCAVSGCEASYGGAIYTAGQAELKDCLIGAEASEAAQAADTKHSNKATSSGGGIYIAGTGELTLNGSNTISYNYAAVYGGGIYIGADVDLTACVVKNNLASRGGGIFAGGGNSTMDDTCEIASNVANKEGATSSCQGGGICLNASGKTFTMTGGKISGNSAVNLDASNKGEGGGVYAYGGTFKMEAGEISGNTASGNGGGINIANGASLSIEDGKISGNSADNGGGLYTTLGGSDQVQINGGEISENHAASQGDGIYHKNSTLKINGGKICDNDETGVYIDNPSGGAWVTMIGGQISGHTDCGVRLLEGEGNNFDMSDGKISDNGIGAYVAQTYDGLGAGFIMSGGAQVVDNCIYLAKNSSGNVAIIRVKAALTSAELPVASICPEEYGLGTQVISFASGDLATSESVKFAVKDDAEGEAWAVAASGNYGVLKTATIYVDGSVVTDGSGTKDSPFKYLATALGSVSLANSTIIVKNDTSETAALTIPAAYPGLTIKSADATQKKITGATDKVFNVRAVTTFEKIEFSTWGDVDVGSNLVGVKFNDVTISDCNNNIAGGGLYLGNNAQVDAENLTVKDCYVSGGGSGGGICVSDGAKLTAINLTVQDCRADDNSANGGGIYNNGTLILKNAVVTRCAAEKDGSGIYCDYAGHLILDGSINIDSDIFLDSNMNPIQVAKDFALATGAAQIPVAPNMGPVGPAATNPFVAGSVVVLGYDDGAGSAHSITEDQVNCFVTRGTALGLEYDGTASPPCGKLVDKSIAGGIKINVGGNITFEVATPSASGEKARFNVLDSSVTPPAYITLPAGSAQIKILQYGTPVYSAEAQEVTATYLTEGQYELYCKAVIGGVTYDTTLPFAAGGKYTPLTLEAMAAGAKVTFDNKATDVVKYRVNGGAEHEIASGTSEAITLSAVGDRVQFFGDNTYYATHDGSGNYNVENYTASNIACTADCYVYGNIMSLVDSAGFASAMSFASPCALTGLFMSNTHIKNKAGIPLSLPATTLSDGCYTGLFYGCTSLTSAPELPAMTLADRCYYVMFNGCTSLATAPALPATTLTESCYRSMFYGCTSLTSAPALPATTLASNCYRSMFSGCTSLASASALPATTLAGGCYQGMFDGCSSLTAAPELPATTLAVSCYHAMFRGCTSLATAPELPATTLTESCYESMFRSCTSLTTAPELPAPTLEEWSYRNMFNGCSNLNSVTCLATYIRNGSHIYTYGWLDGVAATGTFTKAASMADWPHNSEHGIPTGWTVQGGGSGVPAGFVVVEGSTVAGDDKFKDATSASNAGVFVEGRSVAISTFWICDHEVTQAEYQAVMGTNPSSFTGDNLPVEKVSWYDAITYCNKKSIAERLEPCYTVSGVDFSGSVTVPTSSDATWNAATCDFTKDGYRLPTEAEWEYAARGGKAGCEAANPTDWAGTDSSSELGKYAWYLTNSGSKTHEVKKEKQTGVNSANSLGIYDMSGNVWEWCWDWSGSIDVDASTPAAGALSGYYRVYRGGSWDGGARFCSVAYRNDSSPNSRFNVLGFRVVRTAP